MFEGINALLKKHNKQTKEDVLYDTLHKSLTSEPEVWDITLASEKHDGHTHTKLYQAVDTERNVAFVVKSNTIVFVCAEPPVVNCKTELDFHCPDMRTSMPKKHRETLAHLVMKIYDDNRRSKITQECETGVDKLLNIYYPKSTQQQEENK